MLEKMYVKCNIELLLRSGVCAAYVFFVYSSAKTNYKVFLMPRVFFHSFKTKYD